MFRKFFLALSTNQQAQGVATHFAPAKKMARRFIAGETLDEAVAVVKELNRRGIHGLMNEVGESITSKAEATQAAAEIETLLHRIAAENLDSHVSLKPSHVGMTFGPDFCYETTAKIVETARRLGNTVEMDIEESSDVDATLQVYHRLLDTFGGGVRLAIQGYLHRTPADIQPIIRRGGSIRLVKGAYNESPDVAIQDKKAINQAMKDVMAMFLAPEAQEKGAYLALGSHDPELIDWLLRQTAARGIGKDKFEIQMLQGIRRNEQQRLADEGYTMRVYVPYGSAWYPYFMRRLAERPANVFFMARAVLGK